jgi:hypothetical protein
MVSIQQTAYILPNLKTSTQYNCNIVAINRKGVRGPGSEQVSFSTFESPPHSAPAMVHLILEEDSSARLEWSPVPLEMLAINKSQGYQVKNTALNLKPNSH